MKIVKCKDCRFWDRESGYPDACVKHCTHKLVDTDDEAGFGTFDGEPFNSGTFSTGPEFGCIHGKLIE